MATSISIPLLAIAIEIEIAIEIALATIAPETPGLYLSQSYFHFEPTALQ